MQNELETTLTAAAKVVFGTMLSMPVTFDTAEITIENAPFIAATVGFIGKFNAIFYLYTNVAFARVMAGKLLGLPENLLDGREINDALGELTNMHAGHLKSRLCERGFMCVITHPTVVNGEDFRIKPVAGAQRHAVVVRSGSTGIVRLELLVKPPLAQA